MTNTSFSVVLIAYKRKEYIIKAVNSILNQKYPHTLVEIIVVKSFLDSDIDRYLEQNKIFHTYCEDKSIGKKFSIGFEKSTGDIICMLEDDDEFSEYKLSKISEIHEARPEIDVFVNGYDIVDPDGNHLDINYFKKNREFQNHQQLLVIGKGEYNPDLFILLNFYFNNSRFSFTRIVAHSIINILGRLKIAIDILMPLIWMSADLTIAFIPNINNKFMIRGYVPRLKKMLSSNSLMEIQKVIERDNNFLHDYYELIEYEKNFNLEFVNFLKINALALKINIDIMALNRANLFLDLREIAMTLNIKIAQKYKLFTKRIYISLIPVLLVLPLFLLTPKIARKIIIRLLG